MRIKLVVLHRYIGLLLAIFLICSGLTGSIIAFQHDLEVWLNPELFLIDDADEKNLSASELVARIEASDSRIRVNYLPVPSDSASAVEEKHALISYVEPRVNSLTGEPFEVDYDEVFINPVSGEITGRRLWGECCFEPQNIIPFIYKLHNRLLMQKPWGSRILGFVGLLWILMSLVGIYLTFPRAKGWKFFKVWKNAWWVQWRYPWRVKFLQLHKSIGLWCWLLMLSSALSGVSMNLEDELFSPIVESVSPYTTIAVADESRLDSRAIGFSSAIQAAMAYAEENQLPNIPKVIWYSYAQNVYRVKLDCQCNTGLGPTTVYIGGGSGGVLAISDPTEGSVGDFLKALRLPLHSGRVAGTIGSVLVSLTGLMTALLAILGVSLWLRKRIQL